LLYYAMSEKLITYHISLTDVTTHWNSCV